jgi:hypothetical protein
LNDHEYRAKYGRQALDELYDSMDAGRSGMADRMKRIEQLPEALDDLAKLMDRIIVLKQLR